MAFLTNFGAFVGGGVKGHQSGMEEKRKAEEAAWLKLQRERMKDEMGRSDAARDEIMRALGSQTAPTPELSGLDLSAIGLPPPGGGAIEHTAQQPTLSLSGAGPAPVTAGLVAPINRPSLTGKPIAGIMLRASGPFSRDGTNQGDHVSMAGFAWEERTHG